MKDASLPIQAAVVTAIKAKLTSVGGYGTVANRVLVNPEPGDTLPYVVLAGETGVEFATHTTEGMECTVSLTCWDDSLVGAKTLAGYVLECLTDRDNPLSFTGYTTADHRLDFRGSPFVDRVADDEYWAVPLRVRYRVVET